MPREIERNKAGDKDIVIAIIFDVMNLTYL